jgi:hypothetical protein
VFEDPRDVNRMSVFETVLRSQVDEYLGKLDVARRAGHDYEVHLHGARIEDLLDRATQHGIDTSDWVDRTLLASAALVR